MVLQPGRYSEYDPLAEAYDRFWGEPYYSQAYEMLWRLVLRHLKPGAQLLDLCCGTGHVTVQLAKRGWDVTGIDGSEEMLRRARKKLPKGKFILGDARTFRLPGKVDAVISTYDSLNHIQTLKGLTQAFSSCRRALNPGGYLAFDLNREEAYLDIWTGESQVVTPDFAQIVSGTYDPGSRRAQCEICLFTRSGGTWRRSDIVLRQRCFSSREIGRALHAAGFHRVEEFDAAADLGMQGDTAYARSFYLAQSPGSRQALRVTP